MVRGSQRGEEGRHPLSVDHPRPCFRDDCSGATDRENAGSTDRAGSEWGRMGGTGAWASPASEPGVKAMKRTSCSSSV